MSDTLKLDNQLCFPLYAVSKEIIKKYKPYLDKVDLTYTQYIVMMVLWEEENINVKSLGEKLYLDSGTLTPLLKKLESKNYINKSKLHEDERNIIVSLTNVGRNLKDKCKDIPTCVGSCLKLDEKEAEILYKTLYKILNNIN